MQLTIGAKKFLTFFNLSALLLTSSYYRAPL